MTDQPTTLYGFDSDATGDVSVIVMTRNPDDGTWRIVTGDGPATGWLADQVTAALPPRERPPARPRTDPGIADQILDWIAHHDGTNGDLFQPTPEQDDMLRNIYAKAVADGHLSISTHR